MSEKTIATEKILNVAASAFNARQYRLTGSSQPLTITADKLQENGIYALTPPYSLYRKSAIMLAGIAANDPAAIAQTFHLPERDVVKVIERAQSSLNTNPKLSGIFHAIAKSAGIPESWLPKSASPIEETPAPKARKAAAPLPAKRQIPAPHQLSVEKPAFSTTSPPRGYNIDTVRQFTTNEAIIYALGIYNRVFEQRVIPSDIEGRMGKISQFSQARDHIAYAVFKLVPRAECSLKNLGVHLKDPREIVMHTAFKHTRDRLHDKDPQTQLFVEELCHCVRLSRPQMNLLRSPTLERFESWAQAHRTTQAQQNIYDAPRPTGG